MHGIRPVGPAGARAVGVDERLGRAAPELPVLFRHDADTRRDVAMLPRRLKAGVGRGGGEDPQVR